VADHADQALPGLALLVAQRAAHVRENDELHRLAALAEAAAAHVEAAGRAGEGGVHDAGRLARDQAREPERLGVPADQPLGRSAEQPLAGAVQQLERERAVEGEDRDVDLLHHLAQERRGLERAQPLLAQRLRESVHLDERLAERVVAPADARAEREVFLAQRAQQVRQRLQRPADRLARGGGEDDRRQHDDPADRPFGARLQAALREQHQPEHEPRQRGCERQQLDAEVVRQPPPSPRGNHGEGSLRARIAASACRARCGRGPGPRRRG
jgi:hypothetical protein